MRPTGVPVGEERKWLRLVVAGLQLGVRVVDGAAIEPRRRAGLETCQSEAEPRECAADAGRRAFAGAATGCFHFAGVHQRLQESAGREHDGPGAIDRRRRGRERRRSRGPLGVSSVEQIFDHLLPQREIRLLLDDPLHLGLIRLLIGLSPRAVHRRAFAAIEHAELNAGRVDRPPHQPAERVDLADDLPLADAADRRIATHLPDGVAIGGEQHGPRPNRAAATRGLGPGMPGADDDHVEIIWATHHP